jgi:hypothetical protein
VGNEALLVSVMDVPRLLQRLWRCGPRKSNGTTTRTTLVSLERHVGTILRLFGRGVPMSDAGQPNDLERSLPMSMHTIMTHQQSSEDRSLTDLHPPSWHVSSWRAIISS